jgi:hypothetical protein
MILIFAVILLILITICIRINKEGFEIKKRIAILFTGQVRTNSCCFDYDKDSYIIDSINKYILNDTFQSKYDYDIYISVDNANIDKLMLFFGKSHIKNIYISDTEYLLKKINYINDVDAKVQEKYTHMLYKRYIGAEMIRQSNINYDVVVYTRFDNIYFDYLYKYIDITKEVKIYGQHDIFAFGSPEIMLYYLDLYNVYHQYKFDKTVDYDFQDNIISKELLYSINEDSLMNWVEFKLYEHLFKYCVKNNLNIDNTIKKIKICAVYRGNQEYQFVDMDSKSNFIVYGNEIDKHYN